MGCVQQGPSNPTSGWPPAYLGQAMVSFKAFLGLRSGDLYRFSSLLFVRWAKGEPGPGSEKFEDTERFEFYGNTIARQYYKNYVAQIVNRYK